jgi:hypothetical protein
MAADVLARVRAEIEERLRELRPAVAEHERLLGAASALDAEAKAAVVARKTPAIAAPRAARARAAGKPRAAGKTRAAVKTRAVVKTRAPDKTRAADKPRTAGKPKPVVKPERGQAAFGPAEQAIVAALVHGSHTVGELGMVTAFSGGEIRGGARRLLAAGKIVRAKREGKPAYALADKA